MTVHRNKFLFNKSNIRTNFPNLFLSRITTCFGQFLCPSLGVFHCAFGTGMSCRFDDSFQARPGHSILLPTIVEPPLSCLIKTHRHFAARDAHTRFVSHKFTFFGVLKCNPLSVSPFSFLRIPSFCRMYFPTCFPC